MKRDSWKITAQIIAIVVISFVIVGSLQAAENEPSGFTKFWRGLFGLPVNTAKESADVVVDTTKKGVEVIGQQGKDAAGTLTGSGDAAKDFIVNPVKGTAETITTAVTGTAEMPEKAADESWPSESCEPSNK